MRRGLVRLWPVAVALLALGAPAQAQSPPPSGAKPTRPLPVNRASPTTGPDGTPLTPQDYQQLEKLQQAARRFDEAQQSYRGTVVEIMRQEYRRRRRETVGRYEGRIKDAEKAERARRADAITTFERFLAKYPTDKRWTPDAIFRLAELYFEKTADEYMMASESATPGNAPLQVDHSQTIGLYMRLISEFPGYRLIDGAYYLLGFCLDKMGKELEARQAFLALVCANRHKPLDLPAPIAPSKGRAANVQFSDSYAGCAPIKADSRFLPEAWTRVGEYHFDYNELELAISAYSRVLHYKDSPYYDKALYKLAWSYYRVDKYPDAIKHFDDLVKFSDSRKAESGKEGSDLRAESIQYLGVSFAEKDWDDDGRDDTQTGLERIEAFYRGREAEPHVREVYQKLADIYFDQTLYAKAIEVYRRVLDQWPVAPDAPKIQDKIVLALERDRKFEQALEAREKLARDFGKGSAFVEAMLKAGNQEALDAAAEIAEQALVKYAVEHHKAAQSLKKDALVVSPPDAAKLQAAAKEYAAAAKGYAKYLEQYANSKNAYEYTFYYAESLYYSGRFREAATQYEIVRDSSLDNRYLEEAAFLAVKSYEYLIDEEQRAGRLAYPPLPEAAKLKAPVTPIDIPADVKKLQAAYDVYAAKVPASPRLATMAYKPAEIDFRYLHWDDARRRFEAILEKYCSDPVAVQAGKAILTTYTVENELEKIAAWTGRLDQAKCGGASVEAKKAAEERWRLDKDTRFQLCQRILDAKDYEKVAPCFISLVDSDPQNQSGNNDKALNNAAVAYENVQRFGAATRVYERIVRDYPTSSFVDDALFRTAVNYQRFFEFDRAVVAYQRLAVDQRFANSQHRTNALYNAAVLLENDQAYDQAARMFQTYAGEQNVKPEDKAEAFFRSGLVYLKAKEPHKAMQAFQDYLRLFGSGAKRAIEANFRIVEALEMQKNRAAALIGYKKILESGAGVRPASDEAEYVARAQFLLIEQDLPALERMKISGNPKEYERSDKAFRAEVMRLRDEYAKVLKYQRATWTLAAYFRIGYVYELLSKALAGLLTAPCPAEVMRKYKQEGCDIYLDALQKKIEPDVARVDEEVVRRYRTTLEQAAKLGVSNEWTKLARQKANAYKPDEFPVLKDERVDFQLERP